jgi:hypothetical protein
MPSVEGRFFLFPPGETIVPPSSTPNRVFDPINTDYVKKMKQNATFCNKPPPPAPPRQIFGYKVLMPERLSIESTVQKQETANSRRPKITKHHRSCYDQFRGGFFIHV